MKNYPYQWIDSDQKLNDICQDLGSCNELAIDTEFMRTSTFFPKPALIQISDGNNNYLIDPLKIRDFSKLKSILINPNILKVLHSCSEDLEVFQTFLNTHVAPIADTQIAAALLNIGGAIGYANLVNAVLGVELEKGETRSDWLQRPLTETQIHYAIQDVAYLLPTFQQVKQQLQDKNRWQWFEEESRQLEENNQRPVALDDYYKRFKSAWKLNKKELTQLQQLCIWREQKARERDRPRNHVVEEKALQEIATANIQTVEDLGKISSLSRNKKKQYGEEIVNVIQAAKAIESDKQPSALPKPLTRQERELLKQLRATVETVAEEIQLPPEVLAKKGDLEFLVRSGKQNQWQLPERLTGWRQPIIGNLLKQQAQDWK